MLLSLLSNQLVDNLLSDSSLLGNAHLGCPKGRVVRSTVAHVANSIAVGLVLEADFAGEAVHDSTGLGLERATIPSLTNTSSDASLPLTDMANARTFAAGNLRLMSALVRRSSVVMERVTARAATGAGAMTVGASAI